MAQGHKRVTVGATGCGFDSHWRNEIFYIFISLRSGVEAKRGVEFRLSTCNVSTILWKMGNGVSSEWLKKDYIMIIFVYLFKLF